MHPHQNAKRPEIGDEIQRQNRNPANEMANAQKLFRCKIAIRELVAEKHCDNRCDRKSDQNPSLLISRKSKPISAKIAEDKRQPSSPYEKLKCHHQPQF